MGGNSDLGEGRGEGEPLLALEPGLELSSCWTLGALGPAPPSGSTAGSVYPAVSLCQSVYEFINIRCDIKLQGFGEIGGGRTVLQKEETVVKFYNPPEVTLVTEKWQV